MVADTCYKEIIFFHLSIKVSQTPYIFLMRELTGLKTPIALGITIIHVTPI